MKTGYVCGNPDCREFGYEKMRNKPGDCRRCGWELLTEQEFENWDDMSLASVGNGPGRDLIDGSDLSNRDLVSIALSKPEPKKPSDTFTAPACLTGCPIAPMPEIQIPYEMYQVWVELARSIDTEWLAYLQGEIKQGVYVIEDMSFPEQLASGVHVSASDDTLIPTDTIAAVHSHVGMNVFFSDEDKKHFNHPIELVVNNKGELLANGVSMLACGQIHRGAAKITFLGKQDAGPFLADLRSKLRKPEPLRPTNTISAQAAVPIRRIGRNLQ